MKAMKFIKSLQITFFLYLILFQVNLTSIEQISNRIKFELKVEDYLSTKDKAIQEVDTKVAKVVEELGGGVYHSEVEAIVPFFSSYVRNEWFKYKNEITERIGPIVPRVSTESALWENSAKTVEDLLQDAERVASHFRESCLQIAKKTNSAVSFGIKDESIIKSKASLIRKVKQTAQELGISEAEAIAKIRDTVRGTIIVDTPEQIPLVVEAIKELALAEKREVVFINAWEENRPSGYVGVHAKLLFPIHEKKSTSFQKNIIVEIQIHLKCIMDGTLSSVKEREHLLYEHIRNGTFNYSDLQTSASTLLYLTGLKECPRSLISKNIAWQFQKLNQFSSVFVEHSSRIK